jgi:uncharacterized OsmC-like protein
VRRRGYGRVPAGRSVDTETADAAPLSPVAVAVTMRGHRIVQDKPATSGGKDEGPMSSELLLAGLLGCQNSTFAKVAAKRRLTATVRSLHGEMDFKDGDISAIRVRLVVAAGQDVPDSAIETALRLTDKSCTISRVLKVPVHATFERV